LNNPVVPPIGPVSSLQLPLTIDSFTLTKRIGAGAMGEVYLASESLTGRAIAIKVMAAHLVGHVRAETRFRREISAMAQMRHPGIPSFAGFGELQGRPYLAMEYVTGHSLDMFVPDGKPLPEDLALWVTMQICDIIGFCNRETGMIHRDLKPSNVMCDLKGLPGLSEQSRLRVIDFGLASYIDFGDFEDFSVGPRSRAAGGTMSGEVMGTPAYMSPEQIRGEELSFQSDIYAIGTILYHLVTGHPPYTGSSAGVVMAGHLNGPVPDPSRQAPVRPATTAVVQRAMAKNPQARFRSFTQFASSLQAARFSTNQATKRITRTVESGGSGNAHPSTASTTEISQQRPTTTGWTHKALPAQPPPPGSSGPIGWSRPVDPPTGSWRRPVRTPLPALPALEPPTSATWRRPVRTPPPVAEDKEFEPNAADPTVPAQVPVKQHPSSTGWRRPVRTPPPEIGPACPPDPSSPPAP
jgi:serine/threonine protein kinase